MAGYLARMPTTPSAQYSLTLRVEIDHRPGMLGRVASAIGEAGGMIGAVDLVQVDGSHTIRDITVATGAESDWPQLTAAVEGIDGARVLDTTDRTFLLHRFFQLFYLNRLLFQQRMAVHADAGRRNTGMAAGARRIVAVQAGNLVIARVYLVRKSDGLFRRIALVYTHARKFPGPESTRKTQANKSEKN